MEHLDHPSPLFNDAKMARFCSFAPSSLLQGGGWGIIVPLYSVQDCLRTTLALQEAIFAMHITSDLMSQARITKGKEREPK